MTVGFDNLKHLVVLMMENRSFDHMLGGLSLVTENGQKKYPGINGLTGTESNPDSGLSLSRSRRDVPSGEL